jgi:hypothetical protein
VCDAAGVFAHAHIAHAVGSVFNRVPLADDGIEEFAIAGFGLGATAHIVGDFGFGELLGFGEGEVDEGALEVGFFSYWSNIFSKTDAKAIGCLKNNLRITSR